MFLIKNQKCNQFPEIIIGDNDCKNCHYFYQEIKKPEDQKYEFIECLCEVSEL